MDNNRPQRPGLAKRLDSQILMLVSAPAPWKHTEQPAAGSRPPEVAVSFLARMASKVYEGRLACSIDSVSFAVL